MPETQRATIAFSMLGTLYALGFTNLFLRGSLGIMAPALSVEMQLTPTTLSIVASSFFFAYAAMQIPAGMFLDRFGPRLTLAALLLFTAAGAALFALSDSAMELVLARILMGVGCAGIFTGAFYVLTRWVPAKNIVTQSGILNSVASLGGLCATTPLAALIVMIGWRNSYWIFTCCVILLLIVVAVRVRDMPPGQTALPGPRETIGSVFRGVAEVFCQVGMVRLVFVGVPLATQSTLLGVWGAPYLADVHGLDSIGRGNILLMMALAGMIGHVTYGMLARLINSIKSVILGGMVLIIGATAIFAAVEQPPLWLVVTLFCVIAISAMYPMLAFAHAKGLVPLHLVGRGLAVTNMGIMTAIAVTQMLFGWVVGQFSVEAMQSPEIAYRVAFGVQSGLAVLAMLIYFPIRDCKPSG